MLIIPAIDIKNGKCVRLKQGDFNAETVYSDDPVTVARQWKLEGAEMLHIVDLDGAKNGFPVNLDLIKDITKTTEIPIQIGGGIRDEKTVKTLLTLGVLRIVLGTIVFENEKLLTTLIGKYPSQIIVALDVKDGVLLKRGWVETTNKNLIETAKYLESIGIQKFVYTDVEKDGMMNLPNYEQIKALISNIKTPVIISGGISSLTDIEKLKHLGVEEAIIGKALYEGKINLREVTYAS